MDIEIARKWNFTPPPFLNYTYVREGILTNSQKRNNLNKKVNNSLKEQAQLISCARKFSRY